MKVQMYASRISESVALQLPTWWDGNIGEVWVPVSLFAPGTVIKVQFEMEENDRLAPFNTKDKA